LLQGAGKSTTLSILSGDTLPSSGTAQLAGYDILREQRDVRRLLGYCPQHDPLLEVLTVREHLQLYARIKGVAEPAVAAVVDTKMRELDLTSYANKRAGSLSGGNKRKLCVACSLIGDPVLIFLDEPSTGMDPKARRFMWQVITRIAAEQKIASIILTSHAMEEVEALCGKVGIMVGGALQCLGSIQHLKSKFGSGFTCEVRVQPAAADVVAGLAGRAADAPGLLLEARGRAAAAGDAAVPAARLADACDLLGDRARAAAICESGLGWSLHALLLRSSVEPAARALPLSALAGWWAEEDDVARITAYFAATFPGAALVERQGLTLRFSVPALAASLGATFGAIEAAKGPLRIASYSLSQVTLEQVFNSFASGGANPEAGRARGLVANDAQQR